MSIGQFVFSAALAWFAVFAMVVLVHELGHAVIALIYGRRLFSIRILNVVLRLRKRHGKRGGYDMRFNVVERRTGEHGEVSSAPPRSRSEDFILSVSGLVCEAALLVELLRSAPWETTDANHAWHLAVVLNALYAGYLALDSVEPGNDLSFAIRSLGPKRRPGRRA